MSLFPILVKLKKRKCVVIGAGKIAAAKASGLLRNGARVVVIAPRATAWIQSQARAGKLSWQQRKFSAGDVAGAFLVIAATNSNSTNEAVFRACTVQGVLCNVVDDPERCDFFYPAVVRRGPLQIAISTSGRSPALARRLRIELERQFGPEYGAWVEHVGEMRKQILHQHFGAEERRHLMDQIASRESFAKFVLEHGRRKGQGSQKKSRR
jgi:precorrin-2 dehydrogenase / sirohydrochlorin ferrochelatase